MRFWTDIGLILPKFEDRKECKTEKTNNISFN